MTRPRLYLVCGLPGAGKTTRSKEIAATVHALHLCADDWVLGLGQSMVDYEFRVKLQDCLLAHAGALLQRGLSVVVEFGSWHRAEREAIRHVAERAGATSELHFVDAPIEQLAERVRERGGPEAEALVTNVLLKDFQRFERPTPEESALFDCYVGPNDPWRPQ